MSKNTNSKNFVSRHKTKILGITVGVSLTLLLMAFLGRKQDNEIEEFDSEDTFFNPAVGG